MANFHSINGNEIEAHYAGGELLQTVELAMQGITGDGTDSAAWLQRVTTSDGPTMAKSIKGRTLGWNQFITNGDTERTGVVAGNYMNVRYTNTTEGKVAGHKYLFMVHAYADAQYAAQLIMTDNVNETKFLNFTIDTAYVPYAAILTADYSHGYVTFSLRIQTSTGVTELHTKNAMAIDLTQMFGAGNEPSTVAEFEALFPEPYYEYDAGSLLPVNMEGIETVGFNQWDGTYASGGLDSNTGAEIANSNWSRTGFIPVFPETTYYLKAAASEGYKPYYYDAAKSFIGTIAGGMILHNAELTTPAGARYLRLQCIQNPMPTEMCLNLSWSGYRNGEYEAYWSAQRAIAASTYFPDGMRSAGTMSDELRADAAVTRVGAVDLGTLTWTYVSDYSAFFSDGLPIAKSGYTNSSIAPMTCSKYETRPFYSNGAYFGGADKAIAFAFASGERLYIKDTSLGTDAAAFKAAMSGVMLHYALATPTVTHIDPPLNLSYRTAAGGTERIMVPTGEQSAPPTIMTAQGYTAESLRDAALATIAPVENGLASTNYAVGSYLVHGGQLCRVTTAIATGEAITIGTNVTATTVMAEVIALIAQ